MKKLQLTVRLLSTVSIGRISGTKRIGNSVNVPKGFFKPNICQIELAHLRWMLQKDAMKQDMFLLGPPDPAKRRLAFAFCELLNRDMEYIALSSDTTESDLKQRREIENGTMVFKNQAPLRAALNGSVLILDGIERAERNVLPTLNNLLENREIHLEDGSFVLSQRTYGNLIDNGHSEEELAKNNILCAHEDFRVIAIGIPSPPFEGRPIDPPLRSRFQVRVIQSLVDDNLWDYMIQFLRTLGFDVTNKTNASRVKFLYTVLSLLENKKDKEPSFFLPQSALDKLLVLLLNRNIIEIAEVLKRYICSKDLSSVINHVLESSSFSSSNMKQDSRKNLPKFTLLANGFVSTGNRENVLKGLETDLSVGTAALICGAPGIGKSLVIKEYLTRHELKSRVFPLYRDMTTRDLFLRRETDRQGNTTWALSPLIHCAQEGTVIILDGIHRVTSDVIYALEALLVDGEVHLPDGRRLVRHDAVEHGADNIIVMNPNFKVIATSNYKEMKHIVDMVPQPVFTSFAVQHLNELNKHEQQRLLENQYPGMCRNIIKKVLNFNKLLVKAREDCSNKSLDFLSTRQLMRLFRLLDVSTSHVSIVIKNLLLAKFWDRDSFVNLEQFLLDCGLLESKTDENYEILQTSSFVNFSGVKLSYFEPRQPELVPHPLYFEVQSQKIVLCQIAEALSVGEKNLLFIGNQGVGKNKLVDYFLNLLSMEREYIQLHRDSTIQSLTLTPSVVNGIVTYQDSPLVKAVSQGRVLIVDEADKAPLEVVAILKSLVEDGEVLLSDGRKIVSTCEMENDDGVIKMHPDFKLWALANRKGFPFLGNDFFEEVGDVLYPLTIENPDFLSELQLVSQYGPNVSEAVKKRLVHAFSDLRNLVDEGVISYPYSTREVVAITKHLECFPADSVADAVENVIGFDFYQEQMRDILEKIFMKHDIHISRNKTMELKIDLGKTNKIPPLVEIGEFDEILKP